MVDFTDEQEKEIQKRIAQARQDQIFVDYGNQWFLECLSHTANLVNQQAFPAEAHRAGQIFYQQFLQNTGKVPSPTPVKKEDEDEPPE